MNFIPSKEPMSSSCHLYTAHPADSKQVSSAIRLSIVVHYPSVSIRAAQSEHCFGLTSAQPSTGFVGCAFLSIA